MVLTIKTVGGDFSFDIAPEDHLLFLTVGLAFARFQHFENLLKTILVTIDPTAQNINLDNIDTFFDKYKKNTLGQSASSIMRIVLGDELHKQLKAIRDFRNYLAHEALVLYGSMDENQTIALSNEIDRMSNLTDELQENLLAALSSQNITHISEVYIEHDENGKITKIKDVD